MPKFATAIRQEFPGFDEDFDTIEAQTAAWKTRLKDAEAAVKRGDQRARQTRSVNVEVLAATTAGGLAVRTSHLLDAVVTLINKRNGHAAPPVSRALFETCCVPIYLQSELIPRLEKGKLDQVHKLVFRVGLGSIGVFGQPHIKPLKVDSLIRAARNELVAMVERLPEDEKFDAAELIEIYYGPLTEFTHPNWGAITLGIDFSTPPPRFPKQAEFGDGLMHTVASSAAYIAEAGGRAFDALLPALSAHPMDLPNADPWGVEHPPRSTP